MDFDENFERRMAVQGVILTIIAFGFSLYCRCYNFSYFGISPFYYALVSSMLGGLQLVIAFDYYNHGISKRQFGLIPLYGAGIIIGVVVFYLVILNIPTDIFSQIQTILKIEAVR